MYSQLWSLIVNGCHLIIQYSLCCRYCFATDSWTKLEDLPHSIVDHTMTLVDDRWIYIMGGRTENQTLSSVIWSYDLNVNGLSKFMSPFSNL